MKITLSLLLLLTSLNLAWSQSGDCEKLNKSKDIKGRGASSYNKCCIEDADLADQILQKKYNQDSLHKLHAPFGLPESTSKNVIVIDNPTYIIGYDTINKIPLWVTYKLLAKKEIASNVSRVDCFRYDPRYSKSLQASYNDYDQPGEDSLQRGHMKPSADGYVSNLDNLNTFIMTNMVPQHETLNMCEWEILESFVKKHSLNDTVAEAYIISGSVIGASTIKLNGKVTVPEAFYKVYYFKSKTGIWHYWTFYIPHDWTLMKYEDYLDYLKKDQRTIDWIEEKAKVNMHVVSPSLESIEAILDNSFSLNGIGMYSGWCSKFSN